MSGLSEGSCNLDGITICLNINHQDRSGGEILPKESHQTHREAVVTFWPGSDAHLGVGCFGWNKMCSEYHYKKYSSLLHPSVYPSVSL